MQSFFKCDRLWLRRGEIEVVRYLSVRPATGPQRQHSVNQLLLLRTQRSKVEGDTSVADDERFRGRSAGIVLFRAIKVVNSTPAFMRVSGVPNWQHRDIKS